MKKNIAWLGTGIMGSPMALHIANAGYKVTVYNRTISKAYKLEPKVIVKETIKEAVSDADIIFTMLGYPKDVDEVINKIFLHAKKGAVIVDMTTSSPKLAEELYKKGKPLSFHVLDAPVTGGDIGAINAKLTIMVGGDEEKYNELLPIFKLMGTSITYVGKAGNGQLAKLANQVAIAGTLAGVTESIYFAAKQNLNLDKIFEIIGSGSAKSQQFSTNGKKMIENNYLPGFYIKHFLKDLKLALEEFDQPLPITNKVKDMLEALVKEGHADSGTSALILYYLDELYKRN